MKYQLVGEVISIIERDAARIFKVLHQVGPEKEVIEVYCGKTDKKGNAKKIPDLKIGSQFKGPVFPSHRCLHPESDSTWERDWMNIICVHGNNGQMTWHIHDSELPMFEHLPLEDSHYDGHSTSDKYLRLFRCDGNSSEIGNLRRENAELSSLRELAENLEKLESAILATKFSDDESWAAAVARVVSAHLLEGETIISPVQRRAGDVEVIAKVLHEAEFQSDYETVSESGKEECRRIARILSYYLLEGKP